MNDTDLPLDPEEAMLRDLESKEDVDGLRADAGDGDDEQQKQQQQDDAAAADQVDAQQQQQQIEEPRIPKARFDQVLGHARALELDNARLKGMVEAGNKPAATSQVEQTQQQADPVKDRLTAIEAEKDAIWARYDQGEIGFAEMKRVERTLDGEAEQIKETVQSRREQALARPDPNGDIALQAATNDLAGKNDWIKYIKPKYLQDVIVPLAVELLEQRGLKADNTPAGNLLLRQATVLVAEQTGAYRIFAPQAEWPENKQRGGQQQQQAAQPGQPGQRDRGALTSTEGMTTDDVKEKLSIARRHPPDAQDIGTRHVSENVSPRDLDRMSEEEIAGLSDDQMEHIAPSKSH